MPLKQKGYWSRSIPWSFSDLPESNRPTLNDRMDMRYGLQDYMTRDIFARDFAGKRLLEVGCGAGLDAIRFFSLGAEVVATDSSLLALRETRRSLEEPGANIEVKRCSATKLPFPDESFDYVYSFGVLHHMKFPYFAVKEFNRVLKKGGTAIAMLYHRDSLLNAYSLKMLGLPVEMRGNPYTVLFSKEQAEDLFKAVFKGPVKVVVRYNVIDTRKQRKVKLNIPDSLELGWHLIVEAIK
jgi:ubiquinone/menaquinone biosynthesis C-methylase UbiE